MATAAAAPLATTATTATVANHLLPGGRAYGLAPSLLMVYHSPMEKTDLNFTFLKFAVGEDIQSGIFIAPKDTTTPLPLLVAIHGHSPAGAWSLLNSALRAEVLRGKYALYLPSQIGSDASTGAPDFCGNKTADAIVASLETLRAEHGTVIDSRPAHLFGLSRGAMVGANLITRYPALFSKAVLIGGVYDMQANLDWSELVPGIRENIIKETGGTPEAIAERSYLSRALNVSAEVLLVHGDADRNCEYAQSVAYEKALGDAGKVVQLHTVPGGDHYSLTPPLYRKVIQLFFDK